MEDLALCPLRVDYDPDQSDVQYMVRRTDRSESLLGRLSAAFPQHDLDQSANTYLCQLRSGAGRVVQRAQVLRIPNHRRVRQLDELHSSDGTEH